MKASATVLCNNILYRGFDEKIDVSPMKLQKLMYFVCRDYVQKTGAMPISEMFEVWQYGPVLPSVYSEFKTYASKPIKKYATDAEGKSYKVRESDNPILSSVLTDNWNRYKHKTGIELSQITHREGSGWYRAYNRYDDIISMEDMKNDRVGLQTT